MIMQQKILIIQIITLLVATFTVASYGKELEIKLKTATYNGMHSPDNACVIWVKRIDTAIVHTLGLWGESVDFMLKNWRMGWNIRCNANFA